MRYAVLVAWLLIGFATLAVAGPAMDGKPFDTGQLSTAQRARYHDLTHQFRCLVCEDRSIDQSDTPLAANLRRIVARQILAGRSNRQIKAYMVARYGDWVLYDPPFRWSTWLLWLGPFLLLFGGLVLIGALVWRRAGNDAVATTPSFDHDRLSALLADQDTTRDRVRDERLND